MKKIILLILLSITIVMSGAFVMKQGNPLIKSETINSVEEAVSSTITNDPVSIPTVLPTKKFNVLDYGLKGDGLTDDTNALNNLSKNTQITNWYFPKGHTFRLYEVVPPSHVNTIWGEGTLKTIYKDVPYPYGVFKIAKRPENHLLIDGLSFIYNNKSYSNGEYGAIMIERNFDSIHNVEIQNCSFKGNSMNPSNGITIYGKIENGGTKNIKIHHNKFIDIPRAGIEILHRSDIPKDGDGIENINIYNNLFDFTNSNGWKCAVSFSQVRKPCLVANNTFKNTSWDIEINQAANITIRNNYSIGCKAHFISQGSIGWHGNDIFTIATNLIYNNHFESQTATLHVYDGSNSKYYGNYIAGGLWTQNNAGLPWNASIGSFYNNTIVKNVYINAYAGKWTGPASAIKIEGSAGKSNIYDNEIYIINDGIDAIIIPSATKNTFLRNNTIYRTGINNNCLNVGNEAKVSENKCLYEYTGSIPKTRTGAGLQ